MREGAFLDEQLSPPCPTNGLRAVGRPSLDRDDLAGQSDRVILEVAAREQRAVVTNNIKDFRPLAAERLALGATHGGLILLPSTRTRTRTAVPALAGAIERVLRDHPEGRAE